MNRQESSSEIKYSSKVVIVDDDGNIYLEPCGKLGGKLGLFGGNSEKNEQSINAAIRELREELGVNFLENELELLMIDGLKMFVTGTYFAHIYVLKISRSVSQILEQNFLNGEINFKRMTLPEFEKYDKERFVIKKWDLHTKVLKTLIKLRKKNEFTGFKN